MSRDIIKYIEHPPLKDEKFVINGKDFGYKTNFDSNVLEKMINELKYKDFSNLFDEVESVCIIWNEMQQAPNNCIGTIARYQLAREFLQRKINNLTK